MWLDKTFFVLFQEIIIQFIPLKFYNSTNFSTNFARCLILHFTYKNTAMELGFEKSPPPYLSIKSAKEFQHGVNFASAGSGVLNSTVRQTINAFVH